MISCISRFAELEARCADVPAYQLSGVKKPHLASEGTYFVLLSPFFFLTSTPEESSMKDEA